MSLIACSREQSNDGPEPFGDHEVPLVELSNAQVFRTITFLTFLTWFNQSDCAV